MVDVMHYEVIDKVSNPEKHVNVYLFQSDGGRWFSAAAAPEEIEFEVGDILKHYVGDEWKLADGDTIKISPDIRCASKEEAQIKFNELRQ
ncbi:hypothetical protein ACLH1Q_06690 [Klebsiella sp. 1SOBk8mer]|uniref:hypothetical protein n=1 Tax=Klebsiella TaxID=570 RepID=UPI0005E2EC79|nr:MULTISPECIES: hypothetical protein [Klebsiella]EIY5064288.1 hypothetical protein [Klebsiella quasipneumoniae]MBR7371616.1 hypothetical protein [Klebsiella pneumoniae]MBX8862084.1 hypothetical protein [Klebsiella pneumoniae]MCE7394743.1 hypothetical protein [Klebsiella pneumoniae]MCJ8545384.1 hypothetical protein [Klebsiella pneumoniae]